MARRTAVVAGFAVATALLGWHVARHFAVSTELTRFLEGGDDAAVAAIALRIADSAQARTLVLGVGGADAETNVQAAREWSQELARVAEIESVRRGADPALIDAAFDLYFPRRLLFLSSEPETQIPELLSERGLRDAARRLRGALGGPEGMLLGSWAADDPLLAFPARLRALESLQEGALHTLGGGFVGGTPPRAILFVTTRHSAFDSAHQRPVLAAIEASFASLRMRFDGRLALEWSGAHRFAVASEDHARADAAWLSCVSLVGLAVCFLALFRSISVLALTFLPLGVGMLAATSFTLAWFGQLHALTLAFGAALVGICTDYPLHFVTHWALRPAEATLRDVVARIRTPITLAAASTCAGFWALGSSRIPGIQEVGLFAAIGVAAACATTIVLLPHLVTNAIRATPLQHALIGALHKPRPRLRGAAIALLIASLAVCGVGLPRVEWNDDVFGLAAPSDPALVREDRALREVVGQPDLGRMVIATGGDDESALRAVETVEPRLEAMRAAGVLGGFRSVHALLWSRALQERNWAALAAQPRLAERLVTAFAAEGFRTEAFARFATVLGGPAPPPLASADLLDSPLHDAVAPFRLDLGGDGVALLALLRDVRDPAALAAGVADIPGVRVFDQQHFARSLYARYRTRVLRLIGAGALAVLFVLSMRYRLPRRIALATAPALLGAVLTISLLGLTGTPVGLLHLLGLLLVLSLGVDYGIFLVESSGDAREEGASLLSVTIDCATTLLSFGLLAMSSFPALRALGVATGVGIAATLIYAFALRALLRGAASEESR